MPAVWQKVRPAIRLSTVRRIGDHNCRASRGGDAVNAGKHLRHEHNHIVAVPGASLPPPGIADDAHRVSCQVHRFYFAVGEKSYATAIRRPKRMQCALRASELLSGCRIQRPYPQRSRTVGSHRHEGKARAVG